MPFLPRMPFNARNYWRTIFAALLNRDSTLQLSDLLPCDASAVFFITCNAGVTNGARSTLVLPLIALLPVPVTLDVAYACWPRVTNNLLFLFGRFRDVDVQLCVIYLF